MAADRAAATTLLTCALRALTLCDGQQLEQPDRALSSCLCWLEERCSEAGYPAMARGAAEDRERLIEEADPTGLGLAAPCASQRD